MTSESTLPRGSAPLAESKISADHLHRTAIVYVRQSTPEQVAHNLESQRLQYQLVDRALELGWVREQVQVIDQDLGKSGASTEGRTGFQALVGEVALNRVGIVLGREVSRLARNNRDWYQLLDLCAVFGTLIADADGVYDARNFNDRLLLGLKGTISETELHVLRGRLEAGRLNKARRGEFAKGVPVGYTMDPAGRIGKHPDESVQHATELVFARFRELGSVSAVLVRLREEGVHLPNERDRYGHAEVEWGPPTYRRVYALLTNPIYAGAYVYGRTRTVIGARPDGTLKKRSHLPQPPEAWVTLLRDHHPGYISWGEYEANMERIHSNLRGFERRGAVGDGTALLAGLVRCGFCGRSMVVAYTGMRGDVPRYSCPGTVMTAEGKRCQTFGGRAFEDAVEGLIVGVLEPAAVEAALVALDDYDQQRLREEKRLRLQVEKAELETRISQRRYQSVDPENRLVARQLERDWESALAQESRVRREVERRRGALPPALSPDEKRQLRRSLDNLPQLWRATTTTPRDRKEIMRLLVSSIVAVRDPAERRLSYEVRWSTGHRTRGSVRLPRTGQHRWCTSDDAVTIIRKLLPDHTAGQTASILNKLGKRTGHGNRWTAAHVQSVRGTHEMGKPGDAPSDDVRIREAMTMLHVDHRTVREWIRSGKLIGRQAYPHARWFISRASVEERMRKRGTTNE